MAWLGGIEWPAVAAGVCLSVIAACLIISGVGCLARKVAFLPCSVAYAVCATAMALASCYSPLAAAAPDEVSLAAARDEDDDGTVKEQSHI